MKQSRFGIASMIIGIVTLVISCTGLGIFGIVGLVFSIIALNQKWTGKGAAVAGLCTSSLAILISFFVILSVPSDETVNQPVDKMAGTEKEQEQRIEPVTVEDKKIYSKHKVDIYSKGYDEKENIFKFYVENNSKLNLGFNAHAYSVNGIMTNNNIYEMDYDVAKKSKANMELEINKSFLNENGISEIKYIDILFWAYDNDESFKEFDTGVIRIKTSAYKKKKIKLEGKKIYDKKGLKIGYIRNDDDKYIFEVKNESGEYVDIDINNVTINGFTSSDTDFDLVSMIVFDKNISRFVIEPSEEFMEKNEIGKINRIEFSMEVRIKEDYFKSYNTDTIRINIE